MSVVSCQKIAHTVEWSCDGVVHYNCTIFFVMIIRFKEVFRHQPSTYMYECLLLIIMAVEMGVQSAEHLLIAEMLCSNSLSFPTIHYPPFPAFTIPFEVFSCLLQSRESVCVFVCVLLITNTHTFTRMRLL